MSVGATINIACNSNKCLQHLESSCTDIKGVIAVTDEVAEGSISQV